MKFSFNFGKRAMVLPGALLERFDKASKKDIKVLLYIAEAPSSTTEELVAVSGMKKEEIESAVAFWRNEGIIEAEDNGSAENTNCDNNKEKSSSNVTKKKLKSEDSLPKYTAEELGALLQKREEYKFLISECQQLFGKMFNPSEINIVIGLSDYLGLDSEYILLLFAHIGKQEHKSVRMAERLAHRFIDEEITDAETLGARLSFLEASGEFETKVRNIFGISSRALTKKEKAIIEKWMTEYNYGFEMVEKAYEMTVDSTSKASIPYAGAIIDRWYSEGIISVLQVEKNNEEHKKNAQSEGGSFDTDEFLDAALKRSFEKN